MMREGARLLIVDDDHECRLMLCTLMAKAGLAVEAVADGDMALTLARKKPFDLVLLDAQLPRKSGYEVCHAIKHDPKLAKLPIVILTAYARDDAREHSFAAGADELVEKPFRAEQLLALVEQLLQIHDAARQLDIDPDRMAAAFRDHGRGSMPRADTADAASACPCAATNLSSDP